MLTDRAKKIIQSLAKHPFGHSIPLAIIADDLDISVRSIQRELADIEKWMSKNHFSFERKRGHGLLLNEDENRKDELLLLLNSDTETDLATNREARQKALIADLLFSFEPRKTFYYTSLYQISEKTLSNDLNQITRWFKNYNLELVRRPGLGIFITGDELAMRRAFASVLQQMIEEKNYMVKLRNIHYASYESLSEFPIPHIEVSFLQEVASILYETIAELGLTLHDREYTLCLLYITVSLIRIEKGKLVSEDPTTRETLKTEPEYAVAEQLCNTFQKDLALSIPIAEISYIAIALSGLHLWNDTEWDLTEKRDLSIRNAIIEIVNYVGDELNTDFTSDKDLIIDLTNHIRPMIGRLRAGIPVDNPLLENLIEDYPQIFNACKRALFAATENYGLHTAPDGEVGYITMHFGASLERKKQLAHKIRTIVVCPNGIGTSRLLSAYLQKDYPQLKILGIRPASSLKISDLRTEQVDLIISTIKLDIDYAKVQISPVLSKQDKLLLNAALDTMERQKTSEDQISYVPPAPISHKEIDYINQLGPELYTLLDNVSIGRAPVLHSKKELIEYAASLFADSPEMEQHLYDVIMRREALGDTYIKQLHALLLHGKSSEIEHCCFGYVRLKPPVYQDGKMILGAIVSFVPENDQNMICTSLLSEIIGSLIENGELMNQLRNGDIDTVRSIMEDILFKYYQRKVRELIH